MPPVTAAGLAAEHCVADAVRLDGAACAALLAAVPEWALDGDAVTRTFRFKDFFHTMAFVNAVASIAHREDHHPDMAVGYGECRVAFATHSAGGITRNDFICAARVDALAPA
jgi:4a-hydroxytetrahydrobiopterin dehydratase